MAINTHTLQRLKWTAQSTQMCWHRHGATWLPYAGGGVSFCMTGLALSTFVKLTHNTLRLWDPLQETDSTKTPSHNMKRHMNDHSSIIHKMLCVEAGLRLLSLERPAYKVGPPWNLGTWISRHLSSFADENGSLYLTCLPNFFSTAYVEHPLYLWKVMNLS